MKINSERSLPRCRSPFPPIIHGYGFGNMMNFDGETPIKSNFRR